MTFGNEHGSNTTYSIVGEVADEHKMGPDHEQDAELYLPGQHLNDFLLAARTAGDPLQLANAVKQKVWDIDQDQPVKEVMTEDAALRKWSAPRRFNLIMLLVFAAIALMLAALGLYSVLAYTVTLRTREIGIRVPIGAEPKDVARYIPKGGLMYSLVGIGVGLGAALTLTFGAVACLLVAVAAVASYSPAMRAAKIDPMEALRVE